MVDKDYPQLQDLPFVVANENGNKIRAEQDGTQKELLVGDLCPVCLNGHLDYNGLLNLECDQCKYTLGGCFT